MKDIHRRKPTALLSSSDDGHVASSAKSQRRPPPRSSSSSSSPIFRSTWTVAAVAMACLIVAAIVSNPKISRKDKSSPTKPLSDAASSSTTSRLRKNNDGGDDGSAVEYHVIFSTGCTTIQDWQSYVFFYYAMVSRQPGTITRIASGCTPEDEIKLKTFFDDKIATMADVPGRFKIHFTPDYSRLKPGPWYKYFNKPYGTKHWLEHALGFPDNPVNEDAIVILMDPDQIILRPFRDNNFSNTVWTDLTPGQEPRTKIEHGKPMGQLYGFGLQWRDAVDAKKLLGDGVDSPLLHMSKTEASVGYAVGPPYIATARDMYKIASQWSAFVVPIHDQYPELLAEMFAYCTAAAHLGLPHQTAASFMVSDVGGNSGEGWSYIDPMPASDICRDDIDPENLPNVFHYCQRYGLGTWMFGKFRLPNDFLSCEHPLMKDPPKELATLYNHTDYPDGVHHDWSHQNAKRNAFGTCVMIRAVNDAATHYKRYHCDAATANYSRSLVYTPK